MCLCQLSFQTQPGTLRIFQGIFFLPYITIINKVMNVYITPSISLYSTSNRTPAKRSVVYLFALQVDLRDLRRGVNPGMAWVQQIDKSEYHSLVSAYCFQALSKIQGGCSAPGCTEGRPGAQDAPPTSRPALQLPRLFPSESLRGADVG